MCTLDLAGPDHPDVRAVTVEQRSVGGLEARALENPDGGLDLGGRRVLTDGRVVSGVHVGVREARVPRTAICKGVVDELDVTDGVAAT